MPRKFISSMVIAILLLAAISTIALAGSRPQPAALLPDGQQIVTMTPGAGMMGGTPMPGANGMAMSGSGCAMMGTTGMTGMTGMSGMGGMTGMNGSSSIGGMSGAGGMSGMNGMSGTGTMMGSSTMNMASLDDQVILTDPSTWLNNPWTLLGWLLVLLALLAILAGIVLGVLWIVRHARPVRAVE